MPNSSKKPLTIVIISGATGRTGSHVVNAALAQFDNPRVQIVKRPNVRSAAAARKIVHGLSEEDTVICHSLVSRTVRNALLEEAKRRLIPTVDILGQLLAVLSDHLGVAPHEKPGLSYKTQKEYFDRVDAVSFTLEHDDGAGLDTLHKADVVLVGVSRASKSVTCFYLGYRGIRAANVPLIPDLDPPAELLQMPKGKVIGLTVTPHRLQSLREARWHSMNDGSVGYYVDSQQISRELRYALDLMRKYHWPCIDASYMAVEEIAVEVLHMIHRE